jgi:hypothetical protein
MGIENQEKKKIIKETRQEEHVECGKHKGFRIVEMLLFSVSVLLC